MKRLLFILFCIISHVSFAQAPLDSFYKKGATWTHVETSYAGQGNSWSDIDRYSISGDTIINSVTYRKLINKQIGLFGVIRTDSLKVRFMRIDTIINPNNNNSTFYNLSFFPLNKDTILYDFDLRVGDTVKWKPIYKVVQSIDSVMMPNGVYLKRFAFDANKSDYWIWGIGGSQGILSAYMYVLGQGTHAYSKMACYINDGFSYMFPGTDPGSCFPLTIQQQMPTLKTEIYPNPLTGDLIRYKCGSPIEAISISNISGKIIYSNNEQQLSGDHAIRLNLDPGIYFVHTTTAEGIIQTQKLIRL